jgi:hypothetical protein
MDPLTHRQGRRDEQQESDTDRWSVADLIDFDYYVDEDERLSRQSSAERKRLAERDRRLYLEQIEPPPRLPPSTRPRIAVRRCAAGSRPGAASRTQACGRCCPARSTPAASGWCRSG